MQAKILKTKILHTIATLAVLSVAVMASHSSVAATPPQLEPAEFKPATPGTRISATNSDGESWSYTIGESTEFVVSSGGDFRGPQPTVLFCWKCVNEKVQWKKYAKIWPLEVSKSVKFNRVGNKKRPNKISVVGTETLELDFGSVDTYVVEGTSSSPGGWKGKFTSWYAPSIGWVVKREWSDSNGGKGAWHVVEVKQP